MKKKMSIGDKVITILMGTIVTCAILTLVSYLLYTLWNIGSVYFSMVFFMCSMIGAVCLMILGGIILNTNFIGD